MATGPDDTRPTSSDNRRKPVRSTQYMIAPAGPGVSAQTLAEQLNQFVENDLDYLLGRL